MADVLEKKDFGFSKNTCCGNALDWRYRKYARGILS